MRVELFSELFVSGLGLDMMSSIAEQLFYNDYIVIGFLTSISSGIRACMCSVDCRCAVAVTQICEHNMSVATQPNNM